MTREECNHESLIDTGVGYYHCQSCNRGWTYEEWDKLKHQSQQEVKGGAVEILKELCQLKHYKDTVGKDSFYEKRQPELWKLANDYLNSLPNPQKEKDSHSQEVKEMNWAELRKRFFNECTKNDSMDGRMVKIDIAPHDLFEWFKNQIEPPQQGITIPASDSVKNKDNG